MSDKEAEFRIGVVEPWSVTEENYRSEWNEISESIFSLANEYMGCRGNFEEGFSGHSIPGCYLGGIYVKQKAAYVWQRRAFPEAMNSMVNTANWLSLNVEVGGESFAMDRSRFVRYRRSLDIKQGLLRRELVFVTKNGEETALSWERLVSHADAHVAAIRFTCTAINHTQPIRVSFNIDSRQENRDFAKDRIHTRMLAQGQTADDAHVLTNIITTGQYTLHQMRVVLPPGLKVSAAQVVGEEKLLRHDISFVPEKGQALVFDKLVSIWTSRDVGYPHGLIPKDDGRTEVDPAKEQEVTCAMLAKGRAHVAHIAQLGYEALRRAHIEKVATLWDEVDVEIDGDPASQQGIRYSMFQLLSTYRGMDGHLNIGPKGYSGECYNGRAFWDTESYCFPFYLFTHPEAARKLLDFRYNTLDVSRERAKEFSHAGAIYAFTTLDGTEDTGVWEYMMGEVHINAIIGYVLFVYAQVTGDRRYLYERGSEVLLELARYWASRSEFIPYRQGYAINRVMGPNEYAQLVNNNWYTNYMAKWLLEYAIELLAEMKTKAPGERAALVKRTAFDEAELARWQAVAAGMILPYDADMQVFPENDMYFSLDPISREELDRDRDLPIERKWTIEGYIKHQFSKQPDVLLGIFLHRHRFSLLEKKRNFDFYEQRCTHGSSLSPAIHSILGCEVGRHNLAYEQYLWGSRLDLDNLNNNTQEGLHISSMAGSWMNIVFGFGGMCYTDTTLCFSPTLPAAWKKYRFKFVYRESVIQVSVDPSTVTLQLLRGQKVDVKLYGKDVEITAAPLAFPLAAEFVARPQAKAVVFDLDGVIVDTARFHYLAWKEIADAEGIHFDIHINERLKGVSRMQSLDIILERAGRDYSVAEKEQLAARKNARYVEMLQVLTPKDILPGIGDFLDALKTAGMTTAIASASKNTDFILRRLGILERFDAIVSGNDTTRSKPDPEGMLLAARKLGVKPAECVVVEDAAAGLEAAAAAGMKSIGIGDKTLLYRAEYTLPSTKYLSLALVRNLY
jgi:alpha,alpha-trehalose phosphorylase